VNQLLEIFGAAVAALALVGSGYTLVAARRIGVFRLTALTHTAVAPAISMLKPLHGWEPGLETALAGFLAQDYAGPIQLVMGVQDAADLALPAAQALRDAHPDRDVTVVVDSRTHGANAKVANLINIYGNARHDVLVLADSDISVPPDYLRRVTSALAEPGVDVVTCPYFGVAKTGFWSQLAAMGVSYQFLPSVAVGVSFGLAHPCMGSTIALRRETLNRIGGFEAFADVLADDYAIGQAVRAAGGRASVAAMLVAHGCAERSLGEVVAQELRWARTIRAVDPGGFAGSVVTHPIPLALIAAIVLHGAPASLAILAVAVISRLWLMRNVDKTAGLRGQPWWLLPLRDILSFGIFLGALFGRAVEWRGRRYRVDRHGLMSRT
jgi:ceramide glucosyltransferase